MQRRNQSESQNFCIHNLRPQLVEFLIQSAHELEVCPVVKYTALSLFFDRFYRRLPISLGQRGMLSWLLEPLRESNLQLFVLISIWIATKIHNSRPLPVKILKTWGDSSIKEQHFTTRDYFQAVLDFEIGIRNSAFLFLEDLLVQFKAVAKVGESVSFEACMDIMDLLYEKEEMSILYSAPRSLAASIMVASYVMTAPNQRWEFPVLPWVKFVTSCKEDDILDTVRDILRHVLDL